MSRCLRIRIEDDEISDELAVRLVHQVVNSEVRSYSSRGEQYCFLQRSTEGVIVACTKTATGQTFRLWLDKPST